MVPPSDFYLHFPDDEWVVFFPGRGYPVSVHFLLKTVLSIVEPPGAGVENPLALCVHRYFSTLGHVLLICTTILSARTSVSVTVS